MCQPWGPARNSLRTFLGTVCRGHIVSRLYACRIAIVYIHRSCRRFWSQGTFAQILRFGEKSVASDMYAASRTLKAAVCLGSHRITHQGTFDGSVINLRIFTWDMYPHLAA